MKIFGIGTDIVNIKRMQKTLRINNDNFKKRIFSKNEINYCEKNNVTLLRTVGVIFSDEEKRTTQYIKYL